jgi:CheY-like chemotaxis protein
MSAAAGEVYDIIFMDHMRPKMDGIETTNAISGNNKMLKENGFDDFISKPIDVRQLNAILNRLVRDKREDGEIS